MLEFFHILLCLHRFTQAKTTQATAYQLVAIKEIYQSTLSCKNELFGFICAFPSSTDNVNRETCDSDE